MLAGDGFQQWVALPWGSVLDNMSRTYPFGVVPNVCVPAILWNAFLDQKTKSINSEDQTVTLLSRETVPILLGVQKNPLRQPNRGAERACPGWGNARLVLAHKTLMRTGTIAHV